MAKQTPRFESPDYVRTSLRASTHTSFPDTPLDPFGGVEYPGIFPEPDGRAKVAGVTISSIDEAYEYVETKQRLFTLLDEITDLQQRQEQINAQLAHARAEANDLITAAGRLHDGPWRDAVEEERQLAVSALASATRSAERSTGSRLAEDAALVREFPNTVEAWMAGKLTRGHIWVMQRAAEELSEEAMLEFERRILPQIGDRTPSQLAPIARRIAQQLEPEPLEQRHENAFAERAVWAQPETDGMAKLILRTSAVQVEAIMQRLRHAYKHGADSDNNAGVDDDRTMPQWIADAVTATLLTGDADDEGYLAGVTANITLTMPATVLTGADAGCEGSLGSAELPTGQLIDDATALLLAGGATSWTRLFTDPATGVVVTADVYKPTASLKRLIVLRDQTCRFPGCSRPSREGDLDHSLEWQYGGTTTPDNLAALCRRHHTIKHRMGPNSGWRIDHGEPGSIEWTSPLGHIRNVEPEPHPAAIILDPWTSSLTVDDDGEPPPF
ncbi:HNH endonuclease signature motif containing protein [uncultured Agrococcus sp.]|uniref:HNH endonuclease signature motif containing protein n=1 Tax=uncultured Agrococcus sp. TaxID=382258 RepID=UPI0025EF6576|nr:HNH endonuclease signature motif containing protein [uncultured Agrococcus sp.]